MGNSITEHKNAHNSDANMHEVKGFPSASNGYSYRKSLNGYSEWLRDSKLPNAISVINGYEAPPTEVDGNIYVVEGTELDCDVIQWVSGTTVRFRFVSPYLLTIYATGSYLQVTGETTETVHNGVWEITNVSAGFLDVTNSGVTDASQDVASASDGLAYVTHEDFDPESLSNGQSIPRVGQVRYYSASDLWFGNLFEEGDCYYNEANKSTSCYNGTNLIAQSSPNFQLISSVSDLPASVSGVITLVENVTYWITKTIDLVGDRLDCPAVVSIIGSSPEVAKIKSTGLAAGTALITSEFTISLRNCAFEHATVLNLDATANANQVLDWFGVNFQDATTAIGTVKNYDNTIFNTIGFLNSGGLTFDGTIGTIAFTDTIFENATGLTSIILPSTLTVSRRFRINNSSFVSLAGETGLNVSVTATIPNEGYILNNINFAGGGTYLTGVQSTDNKSRFAGCRGINNSSNVAQYYMQGNATTTTVSVSGTFYKVAGTTTTGTYVEKFDVTTTDNKAVYSGSLTGFYKVQVVLAATSGNNKELEVAIYKNGTIITSSRSKGTTTGTGKAENLTAQDIVELTTSDYIEVFISNNTGTNDITAEDLNLTIVRLN